jgi:hypothetical protein
MLIWSIGRNGMNENTNHPQNQNYEHQQMRNDSTDLNNMLAQMPTPVSNNIRASEANTFMSPLQVDQQSYERMNGVQYPTQGNEEVTSSYRCNQLTR